MVLAAPVPLGLACSATLCNEDGGNGAFLQAWAAAHRCLLRISYCLLPDSCRGFDRSGWDVEQIKSVETLLAVDAAAAARLIRVGPGRETPSGPVIGSARRLHSIRYPQTLIDPGSQRRYASFIIIMSRKLR